MKRRETLSQRNARLRVMLKKATSANHYLRESDAAWAALYRDLERKVADLEFERHLAWRKPRSRLKLYIDRMRRMFRLPSK